MTVITLFASCLAVAYSVKMQTDPLPVSGVYSDTLYNRLSSVGTSASAVEYDEYEADDTYIGADKKEAEPTSAVAREAPIDGTRNARDYSVVKVFNHRTKSVSDMPLEEYVACVVAAEMPSDSPAEAFRAQAVAVRTLAVKYMGEAKKSEHMGADICTDSGHCQSFVSYDELTKKYGERGKDVFQRVENAVNSTRGLILLYENQPIVAVFHASSGASTASSKEVWGGSLDYLVSVETAELSDDSLRDRVISEVSFTREEFISKFESKGFNDILQYKDSPFHTFISVKELSESGRVASTVIAGRSFSGKELRAILGLRSTDFEIGFEENKITFITRGYGHGVGMSQLGAVAMANKGESFYSILAKYYPGTIIGII